MIGGLTGKNIGECGPALHYILTAGFSYWPRIRLGFRKALVAEGLCKAASEVAEYMGCGAGVESGVWLAFWLRNWHLGLDLGAVCGVVYAHSR